MSKLLTDILDWLYLTITGHTYRFHRAQRRRVEWLRAEERLKDRLLVGVMKRLREDLAAPDSAGW
jgi:hypothetical protein